MQLRHDDRRASRSPGPSAADEERPSPAQREVLSAAGGATARRMADPGHASSTSGAGGVLGESPQQLLQQSVFSVDAAATVTEGGDVFQEGHVKVRIDPGTRFDVRLDPGGLHVSANPGIEIDVPGPNLRVTSMSYDFGEARFRAAATSHFDVFGMYAHVAVGVLERALDKKLKPRLPEALQKPGYSPSHDPNLQETIGQLQGALGGLVDAGAHGGGGAGGAGAGAGAGGVPPLADPSAYAVLYMPEELRIPLGSDKMELVIPKGTRLDLAADAAGPLSHAHLKEMSLGASDQGIVIQSTGHGITDALKSMNMKRVTIKPGGKFDFDYELAPEQIGAGFLALAELLAIFSGHATGNEQLPDVKMRLIREKIDARLQSEAVPRLREFLAKFDHVLPGFSLKDFFGV